MGVGFTFAYFALHESCCWGKSISCVFKFGKVFKLDNLHKHNLKASTLAYRIDALTQSKLLSQQKAVIGDCKSPLPSVLPLVSQNLATRTAHKLHVITHAKLQIIGYMQQLCEKKKKKKKIKKRGRIHSHSHTKLTTVWHQLFFKLSIHNEETVCKTLLCLHGVIFKTMPSADLQKIAATAFGTAGSFFTKLD